MKKLLFATGGRPLANDDLSNLQQELMAAAQALYADAPVCIVSGCRVSGTANGAYIVSPGILWCDGQLHRFPGQAGVTLPAQLQAGAEVPDAAQVRPYQNGSSLACMSEVPVVLVPTGTAATGEILPLDTWGARRWADVQRASALSLGDIRQSANLVATDYDTTGKGRPGSAAWGWALANGQNGTADLRGMFVAGFNPDKGYHAGLYQSLTINAVGDIGGAERVSLQTPELPQHSHTATVRHEGTDANALYANFVGQQNNAPGGTAIASTDNAGNGQAHENRPPFYVLAMRQWIGL